MSGSAWNCLFVQRHWTACGLRSHLAGTYIQVGRHHSLQPCAATWRPIWAMKWRYRQSYQGIKTMTAYIHTKTGRPDGTGDSFCTHEVNHKTRYLPWQKLGLSYTASGYGKRIPTFYMVQWQGKWRRVYCCIYSNVCTCYIGKLSDGLIVSHIGE